MAQDLVEPTFRRPQERKARGDPTKRSELSSDGASLGRVCERSLHGIDWPPDQNHILAVVGCRRLRSAEIDSRAPQEKGGRVSLDWHGPARHRLEGQLPVSGIRRMRASARIGTFCSQSHLGRSRHAVAGIRGAFDGVLRGHGRRAQQKCLRRRVGQGKSGRHQSSGFQIGEIRNSAVSVL